MSVCRALSSASASRSLRLGTQRHGEFDAGGALRPHGAQPLLDGLGVLGQRGQHDLARDLRAVGVVAQQEALDELGQRHVEALVEHELVAVQHAALAHHEDVDAGDGLFPEEADHVHLERPGRDDLLPARESRAPPRDGCGSAPHSRSRAHPRLAHPALQLDLEVVVLTREEARDSCERSRRTPRCVHALDARPGAEPDVVVEARTSATRRHRGR